MTANIFITSEKNNAQVSESNQCKASRSSVWCDFSSVRTESPWGSPALFSFIQLIKGLRVTMVSFTTLPCLQGKH